MSMGPCRFLECQSTLGSEFRFMNGDGGAWMDATICPDHEKVLRECRDLGLFPIMVTPVTFGLGVERTGGVVWIMPDWLRAVWWPAAPPPTEAGEL